MTSGENTNSDKGNADVWTRIESTLDRIVQMQEETSRQIAEMNSGGIDWDRLAADAGGNCPTDCGDEQSEC